MNANQILDMIGDARGEFLLQAQQHRAGTAPKPRLSRNRSLLIAAMVALMLLLVGCTIAYTQGWFVGFFQKKTITPLTDEQIQYIEENEQHIGETQTLNGWTVELHSAITDGTTGYIILGITAPEGTPLDPRIDNDRVWDTTSPGNTGFLSAQKLPPVLSCSEGIYWNQASNGWEDDGDTLPHTKNYVIQFYPDLSRCTKDPFGPDAVYHIYIQDFVREYEDQEYYQHLLDTKYKDQDGVMFTQEEIQRLHSAEVLVEGIWEFDVRFSDSVPTAQPQELELLTGPIRTEADIYRRYGDTLWEYAHFREDVTVTSALLRPLGLTLTFEDCNGGPSFCFSDEDIFVEEDIYACAVMTDGSWITLRDMGSGGVDYKVLEAESPIVLDSLDHVLLADGVKLYPDGTVAYPAKAQPPAAAESYRDILSETGVYAHYGDFDGDGIEDMAVWYDGSFRSLCLLDDGGQARCTIPLEEGTDVYETYNQRAAEIKYEPNQIKTGEGSLLRIFRAAEDDLQLRESLKEEGGLYYRAEGTGAWQQVSEEIYQRARDDYQVMSYRLYPIQ